MKTIQLYKGKEPTNKYAVVDDDMYESLSQHQWKVLNTKWGTYAKRYETITGTGKAKSILMHREIMSPPSGMMVDHINGDGLDNRKSNLRVVTPAENNLNRKAIQKNNTTGYTGVYRSKTKGAYTANVQSSGKVWYLGTFRCPIEAAIFRDIAALEVQGAMATLNFPDTIGKWSQ